MWLPGFFADLVCARAAQQDKTGMKILKTGCPESLLVRLYV